MAGRQSFFGRHPILSVLLVLLLLLGVGGLVAFKATDNGKQLLPTLENVSMNIGNITADSVKAQMQVDLRNHAPMALRIDSFSYVTRVDGEPMARGAKDKPTVVKKGGTSHLTVPVNVDLSELKKKVKTSQRDCVDVDMEMTMYTRLPVVGSEKIPVHVSKRIYVPKLPKIEVADVDITDLGLKNGEAIVRLKVTNYNPFPVTIRSVNYTFSVSDDTEVKGTETKDVTFRTRGSEIMPIHVRFEPKAMPKLAFKSLFKAKKTPYKLKGAVVVAAGKGQPKDMTMRFNSEGSLQELKNIPKKGD
jgi:LEA14-like dessication related protein